MGIVDVQALVDAGVHFGHKASRWNPKMEQFIYGKRNAIHIIDLKSTVRGLVEAHHFLRKVTANGGDILFVGTKRQAKNLTKQSASQCGMHFVSERWLGGMLTNYKTIRSRLERLEELERWERDGRMETFSKKMVSSLRREKRKILRNLSGVRAMERLPSALVIVDPHNETIAVNEAIKLGIPTVALVDTDSDPERIDIQIPGNDDAFRSIQVILDVLTDAVQKGRNEHLRLLEEQRKAEKAKREAEEKRKAEEAKRKAEAEKKRKEAEAKRKAEEEAKAKKAAEAKKAEEAKKADKKEKAEKADDAKAKKKAEAKPEKAKAAEKPKEKKAAKKEKEEEGTDAEAAAAEKGSSS